MTRLVRTRRGVAVALAAVGCALWIGVSAAAASSASLTVSILPTPLTAGSQGVVQATFNNGSAKLTGAAIFLTFGSPVTPPFTPGNGCSSLAHFPNTVACSLGVMQPNTSVTRYVEFMVPATGPVTVKYVAGYLSLGPLGAGLAKGSAMAPVDPPGMASIDLGPTGGATSVGGQSGCVGPGHTVSIDGLTGNGFEEGGTAGADVTVGSNAAGLPCTPIITGVVQGGTGSAHGNCTDYYTNVPDGTKVQIKLTFPDECMPWPDNEAGTHFPEGSDETAGTMLYEWPDYPSPSPEVTVPACSAGDTIPGGSDACVVSVVPNDGDNDYDAGTITVVYAPNGGDGGFHGG